jgi:hypothetical protein
VVRLRRHQHLLALRAQRPISLPHKVHLWWQRVQEHPKPTSIEYETDIISSNCYSPVSRNSLCKGVRLTQPYKRPLHDRLLSDSLSAHSHSTGMAATVIDSAHHHSVLGSIAVSPRTALITLYRVRHNCRLLSRPTTLPCATKRAAKHLRIAVLLQPWRLR